MTLVFRVYGVAQSMGSKRAFVPKGWNRPIVTDSNRNLKTWQQLVAQGASHALQQKPPDDRAPLTEGVRLTMAFYLPRPKQYQRRGVEPAHLKAPDLDKLCRGLQDALTGVAWGDDSQVIELVARKDYAAMDDPPHVDVRVEPAFAGRRAGVPLAKDGPCVEPSLFESG
jgi:crossover junction endodeoxyribonuclease RusA